MVIYLSGCNKACEIAYAKRKKINDSQEHNSTYRDIVWRNIE